MRDPLEISVLSSRRAGKIGLCLKSTPNWRDGEYQWIHCLLSDNLIGNQRFYVVIY